MNPSEEDSTQGVSSDDGDMDCDDVNSKSSTKSKRKNSTNLSDSISSIDSSITKKVKYITPVVVRSDDDSNYSISNSDKESSFSFDENASLRSTVTLNSSSSMDIIEVFENSIKSPILSGGDYLHCQSTTNNANSTVRIISNEHGANSQDLLTLSSTIDSTTGGIPMDQSFSEIQIKSHSDPTNELLSIPAQIDESKIERCGSVEDDNVSSTNITTAVELSIIPGLNFPNPVIEMNVVEMKTDVTSIIVQNENPTISKTNTIILSSTYPEITLKEIHRRKYVDLLLECSPVEDSTQPEVVVGHRIVLERIPFLQELFDPEQPFDTIKLHDLKASTVEAIVKSFYTNELEITMENLEDILIVAAKFKIQKSVNYWMLRRVAVSQKTQDIVEALDKCIVLDLLNSSKDLNFLNLTHVQVLPYIQNAIRINISMTIILNVILAWTDHNREDRKIYLFELIKLLDLGKIFSESPAQLKQAFSNGSLLDSIPACVQLHNKILAEKAYQLIEDVSSIKFKEEFKIKTEPHYSEELTQKIETNFESQTTMMDQPGSIQQLTPVVSPNDFAKQCFESIINSQSSPSVTTVIELSSPIKIEPVSSVPGSYFSPAKSEPLLVSSPGPRVSPRKTELLLSITPELPVPNRLPLNSNHLLVFPIDEDGIRYLDAFDFSTMEVHRLHKMKRPKEFSCLIQVDDRIYDIGGSEDGLNGDIWDHISSKSTVSIYNRRSYHPRRGPKLNKPRRVFTAALFEGSIYVVGGDAKVRETQRVSNVVECHPTNSSISGKTLYKWKMDSFLNDARSCHSMALLGEKLIVAGGVGRFTKGNEDERMFLALKKVEAFDLKQPSRKVWSTMSDMNTGRRCFKLHVVGEKLYAIGGEEADAKLISSVEVYDPVKHIWSYVTPMNCGRSNFGIIEIDGLIYVIGGNSKIIAELNIEAYDPYHDYWRIMNWPTNLSRQAKFISSQIVTKDYIN